MTPLTTKQADVLQMIERHIRRYGYVPSVREIAAKTGRSPTAAHALINQLEKRGAITKEANSARNIKINGAADGAN